MTEGIYMNVYMCIVCGFIYDEAAGRPEEGIPAGTPWTQVPDSWNCPECAVSKAEFTMVIL
jgi:rubredoxin